MINLRVYNFDDPDDVCEMERRHTDILNAQEEKLKRMEKQEQQLQELKKYIDAKEEKLNDFLDLIEPKIYNDKYGNNSIGYKPVC